MCTILTDAATAVKRFDSSTVQSPFLDPKLLESKAAAAAAAAAAKDK